MPDFTCPTCQQHLGAGHPTGFVVPTGFQPAITARLEHIDQKLSTMGARMREIEEGMAEISTALGRIDAMVGDTLSLANGNAATFTVVPAAKKKPAKKKGRRK
jgi:hypothetical protein